MPKLKYIYRQIFAYFLKKYSDFLKLNKPNKPPRRPPEEQPPRGRPRLRDPGRHFPQPVAARRRAVPLAAAGLGAAFLSGKGRPGSGRTLSANRSPSLCLSSLSQGSGRVARSRLRKGPEREKSI